MQSTTLLLLIAVAVTNGGLINFPEADRDWWKHAVFYQIYPRSFKDSDNNGIGDLPGIISKIDHFKQSGVTGIWLSPIFKSPQVDQGYDISDYREIDEDYGTMDDLEELINEARYKGIKVILDFVPNHTSNQSQWFNSSIYSVDKYKDYYVWADAKIDENGNRAPPNNWISTFKNSAWEWNEIRQQYYLHQFSVGQPDLNYHNPEVIAEMKDILKFWLDKGIDGFRIDAVPYLYEDKDLRDEPKSNLPGYNNTDWEYLDHIYTKDLPATFDFIYEIRSFVDNYTVVNNAQQKVLMTEAYSDINTTMLYYGTPDGSRLGAHFTFNFNLITYITMNSTAQDIVDTINLWLDHMPAIYTPNWVLGNHDNHRVATRFGVENVDGFNMLNMLLPGISVTYNGEEIGQENGNVTWEQHQDPQAIDPETFIKVGRDFERTPYQWDTTINAGFNEGATPWLPVSEKYLETNLQDQIASSGASHYKLYRILTLFKSDKVVLYGDLQVQAIADYVFLLKRSYEGYSYVLIFNKGNDSAIVNVEEFVSKYINAIMLTSVDSSKPEGSVDPSNLSMDAHESIIVFTTA